MEYSRYDNEHAEIFDAESSDRAFEEEVMLSGFGTAQVKPEGSSVNFDDATESFTPIAHSFLVDQTLEALDSLAYGRHHPWQTD